MRTSNGKDKVKPGEQKFAGIGVLVRCVSAPDVESRIDRAMSILLTAAEEYAKLSREVTNPEEDAARETRADDVGRNKG
jgi:site-specific recombinase